MSITPVKSPVVEFYNGANILITGATGFLGKCLLEKLLRVCSNVNHIYVVIRGKKGKSPEARFQDTLNDAIFDILKETQPDFQKKLTFVDGDVGLPNLNINEDMYKFLTKEITHVFHTAATVRFTEKLKTAFEINVIGLRQVINFCNQCTKLKIFVHTSTTYCYYHGVVVKEEFSDSPLTEEHSIALINSLSEEKLDAITPALIKPWPNTYSFTKVIGESIIKNLKANYPIAVVRPSIVMGTVKEPIPGWVDNINGPVGILVGAGAGVLRVVWVDENAVANIVPVDSVVNAMLCSAWKVATEFQNNKEQFIVESDSKAKSETLQDYKKIYNVIGRPENAITWGDFLKFNLKHGVKYPTENFLWYYTITLIKFRLIFNICFLFYHWIPGLIMDLLAVVMRKKPQLTRAYKKIYKFSSTLAYFCTWQWEFHGENTIKLWNALSETDKEIFPFDMTQIDWDQYFEDAVKGIRLYLLKQSNASLPWSRRRLFYFWIAHRLVQIAVVVFLLWLINLVVLKFGVQSQKPLEDSIIVTQNLMRNSS